MVHMMCNTCLLVTPWSGMKARACEEEKPCGSLHVGHMTLQHEPPLIRNVGSGLLERGTIYVDPMMHNSSYPRIRKWSGNVGDIFIVI